MILRLSTAAERGVCRSHSCRMCCFSRVLQHPQRVAGYFASEQTLIGLNRATRLEPSSAENWFTLGRYWQYNFENLDLDRAVAAYRKSLSIDPTSADTWLDLVRPMKPSVTFQAPRGLR